MSIITISRGTFSGGQALAESLAERLGYRRLGREEILDAVTASYGVPVEKLVAAMDKQPSFWEWLAGERGHFLGFVRAVLLERVRLGNVVYHGYVGNLFLADIPHVIRVRVIADIESRVQTAMERHHLGRSEAIARIKRIDKERAEWTRFLHIVDRGKPGGPIVVPGFEWTSALLTGWASREERRPVALGAWHWYAKPKEGEEEDSEVVRQRGVEAARSVLEEVTASLGKDKLLHVWDRGFSGAEWLSKAMDEGLAFVVRWKKGNKLRPADAPSVGDQAASPYRQDQDGVVAWKLTRMKNWGTRKLANPRHPGSPITVGFAAREVRLPHRDEPLYLVVARFGKGTKRRRGDSEPWRLLTNQPVRTAQECWRIVVAYGARWAIEQELRFGKSELGVESVRVRGWEPRAKLLALASLAYAFLVHLLADGTSDIIPAILRWAHRTGRQARDAYRSLYRLRAALANLWSRHTPSFRGVP